VIVVDKQFDDSNHPVVGIDLGTTFSCIAYWDSRAGKPILYQNLDKFNNRPEISSVVYIEESGNILVGSVALASYLNDPKNGVIEIKREMGNHDYRVKLRDREYTPIEVSSIILQYIRNEIEGRFPKGIFDFAGAVISHPLNFKSSQIADTIEAARLTGLNLIPDFPVVPEPVAAALAYAILYLQQKLKENVPEEVLVFDLGGGTFDTTTFRLLETKDKLIFEVLSTDGDARLGGCDFNRALSDYVIQHEKLRFDKVEPARRLKAQTTLFEEVEEVKRRLSVTKEWNLTISNVLPNKNIDLKITRELLERILKGEFNGTNYYERIETILRKTMFKGKNPDIKRVLMVGGSSNIPLMETILKNIISDVEIYHNIDKSFAVAEGAALFAAIKARPQRYKYDKEIAIIVRNPHALGIRSKDNRFTKIILGNTTIPCTASKRFITPQDNTKELEIEVFQGEEDKTYTTDMGIEKIGNIKINELPDHRKGEVEILVTFTVKPDLLIEVKIDTFNKKVPINTITEELKPKSRST
jgi:molecular chaperone DnaK (HSP70)